ncbi:MAG: hypothetical protein KME16_15910 [Scytolyngbya sp. HA4215-MV1]|jgi:uncharacterized membrane-anchored protein YhcB (DUF1043 family)|nr:hypothetical protein [Scytolyngbya sp. HA4215-MV1]
MLPLIIGGLCTAVGFAAGALTNHATGEKDRQIAQQLEKVNTQLINSRDALEQRYYELADISKDQVSDLQRKLAESELEKDALYLVVRLQNSLLLLTQAIDRDPAFEVLFQFREAVSQTNLVLRHLGEELIPIPKDYFSRNLTRAKLKATRIGETLTPEQKTILNKLLPTVSDGIISCPYCQEQNAVMRNVLFITCNSCSTSIDLISWQNKIQWNAKAISYLTAK